MIISFDILNFKPENRFLIIEYFKTFTSKYEIGDPSTIGLNCTNGMNESCKDSMPNATIPERIESECEGHLMFATDDEPSSCLDLCITNEVERASKTQKRRGWTKFIKLVFSRSRRVLFYNYII